jgi:hypothetical protein
MDNSDFERIANDLRTSPTDLDELVRQGSRAVDELPKLLKALDIDEADLARTQPLVLRDMERATAFTRANASARHAERRRCNDKFNAGCSRRTGGMGMSVGD